MHYVYITTNPSHTVLYTGMTNSLVQRMETHFLNKGQKETFAGRYFCYKLVYFEEYTLVNDAIAREKEIKLMKRERKMELINELNPKWDWLNPE